MRLKDARLAEAERMLGSHLASSLHKRAPLYNYVRCIIPIMDNGNMSSYYQAVSDHTIAFTSPGRMLRASEECDKRHGWWKIKSIICTFQQQHRSPFQIKSKSRKWHKWGCKVRRGVALEREVLFIHDKRCRPYYTTSSRESPQGFV